MLGNIKDKLNAKWLSKAEYSIKYANMIVKRFTLFELLKGLSVTGKFLFAKKATIQFPEEVTPKSSRYRGVLALRRYENGEERCIACKLCEATCPALAITIDAEPRDDGSRRTTRFDIDVFKCINCGLCQEACPVDSIVCVPDGNYVIDKRGDNIFTKDMLLNIGDAYEKKLASDINSQEDYL